MNVGECETQPGRRRSRPGEQFRVPGLRQVGQAPVVAEELLGQFRVGVELQRFHDQPIEEAHQEIGEVERAGLVVGQAFKAFGAGEELVAVKPWQALHARIIVKHPVDPAIGAAIRIADEDAAVLLPGPVDFGSQPGRNLRRTKVQFRIQAADLQVVPAIGPPNCVQLSAEGAASDHEHGVPFHPSLHLARIASAGQGAVYGAGHHQ